MRLKYKPGWSQTWKKVYDWRERIDVASHRKWDLPKMRLACQSEWDSEWVDDLPWIGVFAAWVSFPVLLHGWPGGLRGLDCLLVPGFCSKLMRDKGFQLVQLLWQLVDSDVQFFNCFLLLIGSSQIIIWVYIRFLDASRAYVLGNPVNSGFCSCLCWEGMIVSA